MKWVIFHEQEKNKVENIYKTILDGKKKSKQYPKWGINIFYIEKYYCITSFMILFWFLHSYEIFIFEVDSENPHISIAYSVWNGKNTPSVTQEIFRLVY